MVYLPIAIIFASEFNNLQRWRQHLKYGKTIMTDKGQNSLEAIPTQSSAQIISRNEVEVIAPDGEVFTVLCQIGAYTSKERQENELHWLEVLFDKNFSDDKEEMPNAIWRESMQFAICGGILGISTGARHKDRARIGERIRQIREERGLEARDLARLAGIDAANLSRIEKGRYSVGLDILSKIAAVLGKKIDFVDLK